LSKILFKCSKIQVVCHRTAIIYFINYAIKLTDNISLGRQNEIINPENAKDYLKIHSHSNEENSKDDSTAVKKIYEDHQNIIELNVEAVMNELTWKMYDNDLIFGNMTIKGKRTSI